MIPLYQNYKDLTFPHFLHSFIGSLL